MEVKKIVEGMTAVEVAEVIDSNFKNQNKILEEDIATQNSVIGVSEYKDFSEAEAVNVGDVRKYEGFLYECVEATTGAFDASKWKKSSFKAETEKKLSELSEEISGLRTETDQKLSETSEEISGLRTETDQKLSELGSKSVYFKPSPEKQFTDRIKELYLEGLDVSKKYYAKYLQRLISGTYVADQITIYEYTADDKSDEILVALCEDTTLSEDIVPIKEKNDSGISGYWIKHFNETDRIEGVVPSTSNIVLETVSNVRYSPAICEYLESKRIRGLINGKGYFVESLEPSRVNHITELYLEGLDTSKRYYARINQYHTTDYDANQLYIYEYTLEDRSDAIRVARVEEYKDLNKKTLQILADGDSNITGYALINNFDNMSVSNLTTPDINIPFVSNIDNSPILRELYTSKNPFLKQSAWRDVSNKLKELYLENLDINKIYRFKYFRRIVSGSYQADQIHIYQYDNENLDNPVHVATCEDTTFSKGVVLIKEKNNSGIYGYIIKDINENDNLLDLSYCDIDVAAASNLDNSQTILNQFFLNPYKITDRNNYGYWAGFNLLFGNYDKDIYVTYEGAICDNDGYLSNVTFGTNSTTITRFAIGYIDQRNIPIIRTTFSIPSVEWRNSINLIDRKIKIKSGEQLFAVVGKAEESLYYKQWTEENELQKKHQMLYGSINGMNRLQNEFGASVCLQWETISVDSIFPDKQELQSVEDIAEEANKLAQSALSKIGYFTDRQNNVYKAVVVDGVLQLIPSVYKKIILFCNSTGRNGRVYSKGWAGYRGMASSKNGLDYYTHISNGFKQKDSNAEVILKNVWEWEHDFSVGYEQYFNGVSDIDCIIFRAGENVKNTASFKESLLSLIDYCIEKFPTAEILITTTTAGNSEKDAILLDVANIRNCLYVKTTLLGQSHHEKIGHYLYGDYTPDNGETWDSTKQVMYRISDSGVANHANDVGMLYMANKILQALQYKQLDLLHNITIGGTNGYTCDVVSLQWVENGVVNVMSNGNSVSVIAKDGTPITVTNHNDGVFTFDMPNQDVTISVS